MYAKLIDGVIHLAPKKIQDENNIIYNPPGEVLVELGYLPFINVPCPEAPDGYYYEHLFSEQNNTIIDVWTLTELPDEASPEEIADALEEIL